MPPRSKNSKASSKKKQQEQVLIHHDAVVDFRAATPFWLVSAPNTADDFLASGVEFEEAGEKWRAGDAAKAARFFVRALDNYDIALDRFPQSFDLAYNRARVQYSITQHASLLAQFSEGYDSLLQRSLEFHLQALALDNRNVDVLFNAAQVHSSIAELIQERKGPERQVLEHYEKSLDLFTHCLARQEELYAQQTEHFLPLDEEDSGGVPLEAAGEAHETEEASPEEQWATVIEPITVQALLDTSEEILEILGQLCGFVEPSTAQTLEQIQQRADELIQHKVPTFLDKSSSTNDNATHDANGCQVAALKCKSSIFEAAFRLTGDIRAYDERIKTLFQDVSSNLGVASSPYLITYSQSLFDFAAASSEVTGTSTLCWNRLNTALDVLSEAVKRPDNENLAQTHLKRGDTELLRYGLTQHDDLAPALKTIQAQRTVLQNAQTFYKGAAKVAEVSKTQDRENTRSEAIVKLAVAKFMGDKNRETFVNAVLPTMAVENIRHQLQGMIEDSLITTAAEAELASNLSV